MNPATVLGMIGGIFLLAVTIALTARDYSAFWNLPGLGIVLGGTIAATLVSYPLHEVLRVFRVFIIVLRHERYYAKEDMEEIVEVSRQWFKGNLAAIETRLGDIRNPYLRMGIQLVIDDTPLDDILTLLQWRMTRLRAKETAEAQVFRTMAMYAPAFGMLGTLVGLINMLFGMQGADFESIGVNLGIALITTFYGIILANLVFKPIAIKMERRTEQRVMLMNMVLEGITLMSKGRSPAYIRETLKSFMARYEDEIRQ
ncbi:motility protein A [Sulfurivermis fontis]|uniref:motility protein A n=1 Tax=Sulfurivermis fontis TaxID=1972068 RepID=UPI000FD95E03|nr:MotA/TolQ/ExbB proton channel family protein [Sulfurivermis fontis]